MSTQPVPTITKINLLEKAKSEAFFVVGKLGDVALASAVGNGAFEWQLDDEVEYHYCVSGTIHYELKYGDQALPPIDLNPGELFIIPAGVSHSGTHPADAVLLIMERAKPWHAG